MRLHVGTPFVRPENLPLIAESIATAMEREPSVQIVWHLEFDVERRAATGGYVIRNEMLDDIPNGDWVWWLDDDTIMHPDLLSRFSETKLEHPEMNALVISSKRGRSNHVFQATPERLRPGKIDMGQVLMLRDLAGDRRMDVRFYVADGRFFRDVLNSEEARVVWLDESLAYFNYLRPGGPGKPGQ